MAWNSLPLIAPGPSPSIAPIAPAVIGLSPVIMRTSMPAPSAVATASLASARSGSIIPTMPTKARSCVSAIGSAAIVSELVVGDQPDGEREDAQAVLAHAPVGGLDVGGASARSAPAPR